MRAWTRWLTGVLAILAVAAVGAGCGGVEARTDDGRASDGPRRADLQGRAAGAGNPLAFLPTGFGPEYDRAVQRMVQANHLLEERQADLHVAMRGGARAGVVAELRRQVRALEQDYAAALDAMARVWRCDTSACPQGIRRHRDPFRR